MELGVLYCLHLHIKEEGYRPPKDDPDHRSVWSRVLYWLSVSSLIKDTDNHGARLTRDWSTSPTHHIRDVNRPHWLEPRC